MNVLTELSSLQSVNYNCGLGGGKRSSPLHHICEKYFPLQPLLYWIRFRRLNTDHLYCSSFILAHGAARADPAILSHAGFVSLPFYTLSLQSEHTRCAFWDEECALVHFAPDLTCAPCSGVAISISLSFETQAKLWSPSQNRVRYPSHLSLLRLLRIQEQIMIHFPVSSSFQLVSHI